MWHLLKSNSSNFNIFCDVICDTTGVCSSIERCFEDLSCITHKRYDNLQDFINKSNFKILVCSFKSKTFAEFKNEYPELLI